MNTRHDGQRVLDVRSVVVAVAILLIGGALGFGAGYKYEKHVKSTSTHAASHSTTSSHATTPTTKKGQPSASQATQTKALLIGCMAQKGVKYPPGTPDISRPPPGVTDTTFKSVRAQCYKDLLNPK